MKKIFFISIFPLCCFAQYSPNQKIQLKARVISDSGTVHGYFVAGADSTVILSPAKRYSAANTVSIPVNSIREIQVKNRSGMTAGIAAGTFVLGFIVTAGLTKNSGDFDNDGKTSFFELLLTAIEGSTSSNRRRRNTALIVGAAGGTTFTLISLLTSRKATFVFPLSNRRNYYNEKRGEINDPVKF